MRKVNLNVIRPWIAKKIVELIGFEDEVVVEYAMGLLEDESQPVRSLPFLEAHPSEPLHRL
jgi:serine/arginine repetitive matrix protein 1